ncbi:RAP domain-containing protein [Baffinella frigidus]|nr:RAP domain-containing protein [Cryptophyta sp. CCMP2293]
MVESMAVWLLSVRERLSVDGKRQMHQWLLFCDLHPEWRRQLPRSMQEVKEELGGDFRQAFALAAPRTSLLQAGVANQLRLFPELKVEEEYEDPQSGYRIDSRVSGAGRVWAVEVDGPTHFLQGGSGREPSGSTLLKRRQLGELGYTVVAVPYWEWNDLEGKGEEELRRYLQDKLRIDQDAPSYPLSD